MYPNQYSQFFQNGCPTSVSYPMDTAMSSFTCPGRNDYEIVFCPP
jgi:hypothetical protein